MTKKKSKMIERPDIQVDTLVDFDCIVIYFDVHSIKFSKKQALEFAAVIVEHAEELK